MFIVSYSNWFQGENIARKMWQYCDFLHLLLQPCITGLHKIVIEGGEVNMNSLTNSAKDIVAFHKFISEATLCHATATALFHRIFIILI